MKRSATTNGYYEGENGTEMPAADVINLYDDLEKAGVQIWLDGGWGVDALLGKQTRPHKDLDVAIQSKDLPGFREVLGAQGYKEVKPEIARPHNFVLRDNQGHEVDVHVIDLDDKGNGIYGPAENSEMYPAASLTGSGMIDGHAVRCISPEWAVRFHSGYELKEKDFQDVSAVCDRFGLDLPEEYSPFKKSH